MFIHIGSTLIRRPLGHAADFCPVCRQPRVVAVRDVRKRTTLYWVIPLSTSPPKHLESTCTACGTMIAVPPTAYTSYAPRTDNIDALIDATNPTLHEHLDELLAGEERAVGGQLAPDERVERVVEALAHLGHQAQLQSGKGARESVLALLSFALIACMVAAAIGLASGAPWWAWLCAVVAVVLFVQLVLAGTVGNQRRREGLALEPLARALAWVDPSPEEVHRALAIGRRHKVQLAKDVRADRLLDAIADVRASMAGGPSAS